MKLACVEGVLEALQDISLNRDLEREFDRRMAKMLINNLDINGLRCKEPQVSVLHLLNIDAVEVYPCIYRVRRVSDPGVLDIRRDDLVVNPQFFLPEEINGKQLRQNVSLNIVRIRNDEVQMFKRDIRLDLNNARDGELERCAGDRGMTYKKIYDFHREAYGGYDVWQDSGNGVLLDLRNNKGGKLSDMRKVFVKIFKSYQLNGTAYPSEGIINFVVTGEKGAKRPRVAIIMNGCTASSAEIFIRLCKHYFGAVLIGTETYGKDVICKNIQVDGFSFSLPQYKYRIAGTKTESGGIAPDIRMPDMEWPERGKIMEQCDRIWEERKYAEI